MSKYDYLKNIYEDLDHTAAYSGTDKLYKYVKKKNDRTDITKKDVLNFIRDQKAYQYHGYVPRKFVRRPIKVSMQGVIIGSDLCDLTENIAKHNKGYRYILVLIDLFSRKVDLTPLKNKSGGTVAKALDTFFENSSYSYSHLFADEGGEYINGAAQKIYDKYNIVRYNIFNRRFKNSIAERYIRDLKSVLYKYFTQNNTYKFLDILPKVEKLHNSSPHTGLGGETPYNVHKLTDLDKIKEQEIIQLKQKIKNYGNISRNEIRSLHRIDRAFTVGSHVRILLNDAEKIFGKSYEKIFSDEIFIIRKVDKKLPISYWLSDLKNRNIKGVVYHKELKKIKLPEENYVEKVVKTRKNPKTGKKEYLVRWLGYPDEFDEYVDRVYKV